MTELNLPKNSDDFKLVMVFGIEGKNTRAVTLHLAGILATLVAVAAKIVTILTVRAH